jgi:hypothetical protein
MNTRTLILIGVAIALVGAIYLIFTKSGGDITPTPTPDLLDTIEDSSGAPSLDLPSASPLDELVPNTNPIEEANPFKDVYKNPFE